jgi:glycerol-3-phosphate acyltransferase PlsX
MGGDNAPQEVVRGAVDAQRQGADVVLVGNREAIERCLDGVGAVVPVVPASEVVGMGESVAHAVRREDSSLARAADLVASDDAAAVVSCGNSAAIMAIAFRKWGRLPGIERPAFGGFLPSHNNSGGGVFVLDVGAYPEAKAHHLLQFAVMGDVYVRLTRRIEKPRIALLSNGTEDSKGTKQVKEANEALRKLDLNFVGNIEGNQVFEGVADVIVCDGFAGNVLLKGAEGVATEIFELLREEVSRDFVSRIAAAAMMPALTRIKRRVDYEEYGGVPVLGVNNIMINCHGRSKAKAVMNAILLAQSLAQQHLTERIHESLQQEDVEARRSRLARALHLRTHE